MTTVVSQRAVHAKTPRPPPPAWRAWALRGVALVFFTLVGWVLVRMAHTLEWSTVWATLAGYGPGPLALAVAFAACSYAVYAGIELLARRYSGHRLPPTVTGVVGAVSYAFNLNLGAWLGGIGFRYRLYSRLGVAPGTTARLYLGTLLANWGGYIALAGTVFLVLGLGLPPQWELSDAGLRLIGAALLATAIGWLALCAFSRQRAWSVRGHAIELPGARLALLQMVTGASNWMLMAGIVWVLLPHGGPLSGITGYGTVLAVMLVACIAGVATHIPAGLGVLEAVFITLLGHQIPHAQLVGALLAYRAVYYLLPLAVAGAGYAVLEARMRRSAEATP
jgi:glycosyltransferase 2 family protein